MEHEALLKIVNFGVACGYLRGDAAAAAAAASMASGEEEEEEEEAASPAQCPDSLSLGSPTEANSLARLHCALLTWDGAYV